jgi:antitoxin (DNA-binding transcriptional repressor) of toxin-antitoxin stability system
MGRKAREIAIGDFKENCLAIFEEVMTSGEEVVVTNQGTQVARIGPVEPIAPIESLRGSILHQGDLISPVIEWPANDE